MYNSRMITV